MKEQRLYRDLAKYYDAIYASKDYENGARTLKQLIAKNMRTKGKDLLEVACGTGRFLQYFTKDFQCMGIDVSDAMVRETRKRLKKIPCKQADMIHMNLQKKFDVILCLFSSIGYVRTEQNLRRTLRNFADHLKPGGVVIIEPWFTNKTFGDNRPWMSTYEDDHRIIVRVGYSRKTRNLSVQDIHYLISEKGRGVKHYVDRHILGLFDTRKTLELMESVGLVSTSLKEGLIKDRGLFIGVKSTQS